MKVTDKFELFQFARAKCNTLLLIGRPRIPRAPVPRSCAFDADTIGKMLLLILGKGSTNTPTHLLTDVQYHRRWLVFVEKNFPLFYLFQPIYRKSTQLSVADAPSPPACHSDRMSETIIICANRTGLTGSLLHRALWIGVGLDWWRPKQEGSDFVPFPFRWEWHVNRQVVDT